MSLSTLQILKTEKRDMILSIAKKHGIKNVRLFGSVAREEDTPQSDIDFLINLEDGRNILDWLAFQHDLEDALGREIDVFPERNLRPFIKPLILAESQPL